MDPAARARRLAEARLYFVCDAGFSPVELEGLVAQALAGGADIVQLRDKHAPERALRAAASLFRAAAAERGALFILNDRPELAAGVGADGVHVGQDDAPPSLARRLLGAGAIVGLSTHAPGELDASASQDVDYVSTGPVAPTPTKPGRAGTGLDYLRYAASTCTRPFFVTGGVTPETVVPMLEAGARRFVVVRWLTESDDPERNARAVRTVVDRYW